MRTGYLVEYSKKTGFFFREVLGDNIGEQIQVCSGSKLIELLQDGASGIVWSAKWINIIEYQANHTGEELEEWGF